MTGERRFPPPWTVEEYRGISYIVRDPNNFPAAYIYFESEQGRRAACESHDQGGGEEDCGRYRQAAGAADAAAVLKAPAGKLGPPAHRGLCARAPPEGGREGTHGTRWRYGLGCY